MSMRKVKLFWGIVGVLMILVVGSFGIFAFVRSTLQDEKVAEMQILTADLQNIPKSDYHARAQIYERLVELEPNNRKYQSNYKYLLKKSNRQYGRDGRGLVGFETFDTEMQYAIKQFGCTDYQIKSSRETSGAVLECPFAERPSVVWRITEDSQKNVIRKVELFWVTKRKMGDDSFDLNKDHYAKQALKIFVDRYAARQWENIASGFTKSDRLTFKGTSFKLFYDMKRNGMHVERSLLVRGLK